MDIEDIRERIELRKEQFKILTKNPKPHEVNMKVNTCNEHGFSILVYLTSAFVANRLNESGLSYSLDFQERESSVLAKLTYFDVVCEQMLTIKDVGVTSVNAGQKNQSIKSGFSDATKRVYSRLAGNPFSGIPRIQIRGNVWQNNMGKWIPAYGYNPTELNITKMDFIGNQCSTLIIADKNGNIVFYFENNVLISNYVPDEEHSFTDNTESHHKQLDTIAEMKQIKEKIDLLDLKSVKDSWVRLLELHSIELDETKKEQIKAYGSELKGIINELSKNTAN